MVKVRRVILFSLLLFFLSLKAYPAFRLGEDGPKISGFAEIAFAGKLGSDITKRDNFNMLEERLQLKTTYYPEFCEKLEDWMAELSFRGDFTVDQYYDSETNFDLREMNLSLSLARWVDLKVGRQVFTWGTGDYLFINDLFPKDYVSFYIGRHDSYLKKPSDGLKLSFYSKTANLDFIVMPVFEPNKIFTGDRLSFFDSFSGGIAGRNSQRTLIEPSRNLGNAEFASRIYRNIGSYEAALYGFRGFYKMPRGYLNEAARELFYPRLDAYGFSLRGPALGGIANFELGYYNSRQDTNGDNRLIENSMLKYMFGYSKDLGNDFSVGVQYLNESTLDYDQYQQALLDADFRWDKSRHLATMRLTKLYKSQTVRVNMFIFYSPSDKDGYLRPSIDYDFTDNLKISLGGNFAWGEDMHTQFGQMKKNKNIFLRLRYSF